MINPAFAPLLICSHTASGEVKAYRFPCASKRGKPIYWESHNYGPVALHTASGHPRLERDGTWKWKASRSKQTCFIERDGRLIFHGHLTWETWRMMQTGEVGPDTVRLAKEWTDRALETEAMQAVQAVFDGHSPN